MSDARMETIKEPVKVAEYLFRRLLQVGVKSVHGVPGDYNLIALDYLQECGLRWVGNVNELNAAYAADGYARVNKMGAIVTTFGVGELCAINGVAGAYSEHIPVVHIVGSPSTLSQRDGMLLHHTLGNGDFNVFCNMSRTITCDVAKLNDPAVIAQQIDHALQQCFVRSRPVYIMLPTDMVEATVEGARLNTPLDLSDRPNHPESEAAVVQLVLEQLHRAKNPTILIDACAIRHRVTDEVNKFIDKTGLPFYVTPMGKSAIDESKPTFRGLYAGAGSVPASVQEEIESSDLVLTIGALKSDFNTAGFSYRTSQLRSIDFHSDHCLIGYASYANVGMRGVLRKLTEAIDPSCFNALRKLPAAAVAAPDNSNSQVITQSWFWPRLGGFLQPHDVVVTETGTANFGIWNTRMPDSAAALNQVLWGSIGWSVGACQGAALGARDAGSDRRVLLLVGDGSFQLTAQEVSTMLRLKLKPILFVICNEGYTIERFIHGMDASYNDISEWDHKTLLAAFADPAQSRSHVVKTRDEVDKLFANKEFANPDRLQLVEIHMPKKDAPDALITTAKASAEVNAKVA